MGYLILLFSLLFTISSEAATCPFGTKIFYGNGMFNTEFEALESSSALQALGLSEIESLNNPPTYDLAYNRNESAALNALSVIVQKLNNNYKTAWRFIFGLELPPLLTALDLASFFLEPIQGNQDRMIEQYKTSLKEGNRVILVSHSQGNFFAEEALRAISPYVDASEKGMGNIRVATPTYSSFSFPYTTFSDDLVINSVRKVTGAPRANLPAIGAGSPPRDPIGHNFLKAYLGTVQSRNKIKTDIISVAKETEYPQPGDAFTVEINSQYDDGLVFDMATTEEDDYFLENEKDRNLQSYSLSCKKTKEGEYSLALKTTFIHKSQCPCKFKIKINLKDSEESFEGSYNLVQKPNGKLYHVITGDMPFITMKKREKDYEVTIKKKPYPEVLVH